MDVDLRRRGFVSGAAGLLAAAIALRPARTLAQAPVKRLDIRIINSNANAQLAFEELLNRQGYLEAYGLNATTLNVADGTKVLASIISGEMDICMISGFGQILPAIEHGGAVKVIGAANMLTPQGVLTNRPDVHSVADLVGKKIGTGPIGALEYQLTIAVLLKHGVDPASVTIVNVGNTADIFRAISAGVIDAGPVNIDVYDKQKGNLKIVSNMWTDIPDYPYQGSFTSDAAIRTKREALVRTLAAYCKLYRFLQTPESQEPYIRSYVAAVGGQASDAELQWKFLYDNKAFSADLIIPERSLQFLQDLGLRTKTQQAILPFDKISDLSLARDALKLL